MAKSADILRTFGERVRKLRLEKHWSQEDFAHHCQLDRTYVGGIERGERNVALRNIRRIAEALGISLADLMKGL
jgi:transcriptional regulator with XRE-family HTH domain